MTSATEDLNFKTNLSSLPPGLLATMLGSTAVLPLGPPPHLPGPGSELPASVDPAPLEVEGQRGGGRLTHPHRGPSRGHCSMQRARAKA